MNSSIHFVFVNTIGIATDAVVAEYCRLCHLMSLFIFFGSISHIFASYFSRKRGKKKRNNRIYRMKFTLTFTKVIVYRLAKPYQRSIYVQILCHLLYMKIVTAVVLVQWRFTRSLASSTAYDPMMAKYNRIKIHIESATFFVCMLCCGLLCFFSLRACLSFLQHSSVSSKSNWSNFSLTLCISRTFLV